MHVLALALLRRQGIPLKRRVMLLAVSDEELDGFAGTKWVIDNHWDRIRSEYVWDEGGVGTRGIVGEVPVFTVPVAEKRSAMVRLVA